MENPLLVDNFRTPWLLQIFVHLYPSPGEVDVRTTPRQLGCLEQQSPHWAHGAVGDPTADLLGDAALQSEQVRPLGLRRLAE